MVHSQGYMYMSKIMRNLWMDLEETVKNLQVY